MLGYSHTNNDVFIFFEDEEISQMRERSIHGEHITANYPEMLGALEASLNDTICRAKMEPIATEIQRVDGGHITSIQVFIKKDVYVRLIERGTYELHQGYRHISLLDTQRLDFNDQLLYEQLKDAVENNKNHHKSLR